MRLEGQHVWLDGREFALNSLTPKQTQYLTKQKGRNVHTIITGDLVYPESGGLNSWISQ